MSCFCLKFAAIHLVILRRMKTAMILTTLLSGGLVVSNTLMANPTTPPTARTACYAQVLIPAVYQAAEEKVVTFESSPLYQTTPTQLSYGERKIKVADAYVTYEIIPAVFAEVTEVVEIERERNEIEVLPPTYRTEVKRVKTKEASIQWNPACAPVTGDDASSIPPACLLESPAEYQEVTRELIATPARTVKRVIPAKTQTVTRKILVEPAKIVRKEIPAVYVSIPLSRVEQAAKLITTPQPEQSQKVPVLRKVQAERFGKMPVLCETQADAAFIQRLQQRLQQLGYYTGKPSGAIDTATRAALTRFQQDNRLASGAITLETLQKLGLPYRP